MVCVWSPGSGSGGLEVWSTGVPPYLFGPSEVWRRRDAHFLECGGEQNDAPGHARTRQVTLGRAETVLLLARRHKGKGSCLRVARGAGEQGGTQDFERGGSEACED